MGTQTMGSQGGGQQSQYQSLARQSSLYSLTLDEVQNHLGDLGKPLSSMNLDELLKNVWSVETNQALTIDTEDGTPASQFASVSGLQRQGSLTLTQAMSKKTVDEVWRDIQQGKKKNSEMRRVQERQPTLGEMTLEDFLVRAGIVAGDLENRKVVEGDLQNLEGICNVGSVAGVDPMVGGQNFTQQAHWLQYQQQSMMGGYMPGHPVAQPLGAGGSPLLDVGYPENQMGMSSPAMGTLSDTQTPGRKRNAPGEVVEKTVERRQKRMIKNRESAARSRARKQAYTNELEIKVSRLEEENERLRKLKELDRILYSAPFPEPKYRLRRTSSAPL
ncbi:ABSCISIC ACID-INSENSITIVE 5-like protein 2 [Magnolia sinica]|uniref:ABSCISIC ACID-INSENSITIVE 5-like protein 2 n=1 Tax=Magnolia sinica TaxID=86752 RepID=UPI002659CA32|nr:ABSCISIC ACID-INSENSITIVE 5-like protein 2 [Magnolia sinica]XP_058107655.1 ABSCISIC ACID-INSENSITIVE 5-like protein 2 [Magnolia sinica]